MLRSVPFTGADLFGDAARRVSFAGGHFLAFANCRRRTLHRPPVFPGLSMTSITRLAPRILAGSAVAGLGFDFGGDIYRATKKHWALVLIIVALASCLYGLFVSSVWMARNYRTRFGSIGKRLAALSVFVVCYCALLYVSVLLVEIVSGTTGSTDAAIVEPTALWETHADSLTDGSPLSIGFGLHNAVAVGGFIVGLMQRRKRYSMWQAEDANATFLADHGLQALDDENMRDTEGRRSSSRKAPWTPRGARCCASKSPRTQAPPRRAGSRS